MRFSSLRACRSGVTLLLPAVVVPALVLGGSALSEEGSGDAPAATHRLTDRCAQFGPGYVDSGQGVCTRVAGHLTSHVTSHIRVWIGPRAAALDPSAPAFRAPLPGPNPFAAPAAANAALRTSDSFASDDMVPDRAVTHLRIHGSLDGPNP